MSEEENLEFSLWASGPTIGQLLQDHDLLKRNCHDKCLVNLKTETKFQEPTSLKEVSLLLSVVVVSVMMMLQNAGKLFFSLKISCRLEETFCNQV